MPISNVALILLFKRCFANFKSSTMLLAFPSSCWIINSVAENMNRQWMYFYLAKAFAVCLLWTLSYYWCSLEFALFILHFFLNFYSSNWKKYRKLSQKRWFKWRHLSCYTFFRYIEIKLRLITLIIPSINPRNFLFG